MTTWRKSSYSGSQADCVEVGHADKTVKIRDTKDRHGVVLRFAPGAWHVFATELKRP